MIGDKWLTPNALASVIIPLVATRNTALLWRGGVWVFVCAVFGRLER